ncbi:sulfotransferase family protein [Rhodobacter capsulatus]|uniref:sulfotransferase family protein n=1 Tax=Rhodobacter capsulatus TaxID=1061 RepID=UPI0003D39C15|nr:sulfotransferase family protein [Rhodobacter capsulatus]ETD80021.1 hypothetical protein U716_13915 [Rhodobacter capsulatus B6]
MTTDAAQDILITGLPRSGTTLTCHLLNKLANCVALHEPIDPATLAGLPPEALGAALRQFCAAQRDQVLTRGTATSKAWHGRVPSNPMADADAQGRRKRVLNGMELIVRNVDRADFRLFVKQNAFFTAALPMLTPSFRCFGILRNPLAVLLSWRTAQMPVTEGRLPAAEWVDAGLAAAVAAEPDLLQRQFLLLDFCFGQYRRFLPGRTIRYEEIIRTGGAALAVLAPAAAQLSEPLQSRNLLGLRTDPAARDIAARLLERDSPCWSFYDRAEVEALLTADQPPIGSQYPASSQS